MINLKSWMS